MDPTLADVLVQDLLAKKGPKRRGTEPGNILSERELQVLRLVARGFSSQQIAKQILVGVKTVETYRSRLVARRSEFVSMAGFSDGHQNISI